MFQFHKGAIKTVQPLEHYINMHGFQFHKGAIKTRYLPVVAQYTI